MMPNETLPTIRTGFTPSNLSEAMQFAEMLAESDMVPANFRGKAGNVMLALQWAAEIGVGPLQALNNIAVINGRATIWGDLALAMCRGAAVCADVIETLDRGDGKNPDSFMAVCTAKRKGAADVVRTFSVADARKAGLWDKQGPWKAYPKRMLQMRARGFALRDAFPDVLRGVLIAEEQDDAPIDPAQARNVTPPRMELHDEPPLTEQASAPAVPLAADAPVAGANSEAATSAKPPEPKPAPTKAPAADLQGDRSLDFEVQIGDAKDATEVKGIVAQIEADKFMFPLDKEVLLAKARDKLAAIGIARAGR